jgi:plasmid stability protein
MATVTIRNLDDDVVDKLKERAKLNQRSLEAELRQVLAEVVQPSRRVNLRELADRIAAMTPNVPQTDSGILQAEGREER